MVIAAAVAVGGRRRGRHGGTPARFTSLIGPTDWGSRGFDVDERSQKLGARFNVGPATSSHVFG